jgi:glycosyltransferase involved in cell wall biosynthesis
MPRVSIVVPFLNAEPFFQEAIDCVLQQEFQDWELLLVDDGSRDESAERARRLAREQPRRVRYLQHPGGANHGISASLNLGIRNAAGDLVALLDADDLWFPSKLA